MKNWLASIKKGWSIYELPNKETAFNIAFNIAVCTDSDFIEDHLVGDLQLTWSKEYANDSN